MCNIIQKNIIAIIRSDLKYRWAVKDICNQLFISKSTLYRILKKNNVTFSEILIFERLNSAKNLLIQTNLSIKSIAYECGFQSPSYFGKRFRSTFGVTPSYYRKSISN
ncbi:helix-turn-helix transcriptional regulator [Vibrio sp. B1REV9]|uniref:helix-turn-helix transcriptional regulator n=1 Tax=Vibrio sp. B1REV9 TaxID=2751179 RepID=UPI001CC7BEF8